MTEETLITQQVVERRVFLKTAAMAAWITPVVLTIGADRAGAQSCVPQGAPCDACVGVNCCIAGSDPLPCCCSDANDVTTCAGVCRSQAACAALFPGGPASDPDSCFYPGGTGTHTSTLSASSVSTRKSKTHR